MNNQGNEKSIDTSFRYVGAIMSISCLLAVIGIVVYLASLSYSAIFEVGIIRFFRDAGWYPALGNEGSFGLLPMVVTSLVIGCSSMALTIPIAFVAVMYAQFFASHFQQNLIRRSIEVLNAIPSVVYGLVGLTVVVPFVNSIASPGTSLLSAVLVLVPMTVPTAALFYFAAIENLPRELPQIAAALNLSRTCYVFNVVLPFVRPQIISGGLLAFARAIGETMAVVMVAGNVIQIPESMFSPVRTLTANIALEMGYALGAHRSALFFTGLVLVLLVLVSLLIAEIFTQLSKEQEFSA